MSSVRCARRVRYTVLVRVKSNLAQYNMTVEEIRKEVLREKEVEDRQRQIISAVRAKAIEAEPLCEAMCLSIH